MNTISYKPHISGMDIPTIDRVPASRPLIWLAQGWSDFRRGWRVSLSYGVIFAAVGWMLMLWARDNAHLTLTLISGFALVAPFLAIGFYSVSSRLENGLDAGSFLHDLATVRRNSASIGLFALMLAFILSAWERVSALLVGIFLSGDVVVSGYFSLGALFDSAHLAFIVAYVVFGLVLAGVVFAISVVSLPMMLDRSVDTVTAVITSLQAVLRNPLPMLVWAALIAMLTLVGAATALVGLAVLFPVMGHATWHAYRDMVEMN